MPTPATGPHVAQSAALPGDAGLGGAVAVAVTIGNFDGVHRGHAALIAAGRAAVGNGGGRGGGRGRVVVLSFDPNPLALLRPEAVPPRLSTFAQRTRWLKELGADEIVQVTPTREYLQQDAETFLERLCEEWKPAFIVEGSDFRFGRGRGGSIDTLRSMESRFGYRTIVVDPVEVALSDQSLVRASSSLARWLLLHGRVRDAMIVLGRPLEIEAKVVPGDRRGRDIGFPTANLAPVAHDQLLPGDGIYAGIALPLPLGVPHGRGEGGADRQRAAPNALTPDPSLKGRGEYIAAISIGTKPTFGEHPRVCEAHLLDYHGPLDEYGWTVHLQFTHWLRDQLTFSDATALIEQLQRDVAQVRELLSNDQSPRMAMRGLSPMSFA
jgi:riboflavin kinase / FMN adenylyltransferase